MKTYDVITKRDGKFWFIEIPALDGATQSHRLTEVEMMARDYIEILTEETDFELNLTIELPPAVSKALEAATEHRKQSDEFKAIAANEYRQAALTLKQDGLTIREIGKALDISHQRAQQLVSA